MNNITENYSNTLINYSRSDKYNIHTGCFRTFHLALDNIRDNTFNGCALAPARRPDPPKCEPLISSLCPAQTKNC